jgi:uncharacterized protein YjbI with pentapeptide repeats
MKQHLALVAIALSFAWTAPAWTDTQDSQTNINSDTAPVSTPDSQSGQPKDKGYFYYPQTVPSYLTGILTLNAHPKTYPLSSKNFAGQAMPTAIFNGLDLSNANFTNSILSEAKFKHTRLDGADFTNANLMGTNFSHASLTNVSFLGADLTNVGFDHADLKNARYDKYTKLPSDFIPQNYGMIFQP